jgi:UDP-glucose 4-epimerase
MLDSKGKFMAQHILVTGGAGYIGGSAVRLLLQNDYHVTVLDNLSRGHRNSLPGGVPLVVGDTGDAPCLAQLFSANKFDAVMHFAAFAEVGESMLHPAKYFQNNTSSTLALLEACLAHGVSKFVFSSSCAVFGLPDSSPISEAATKRPSNPYGQSKLQTEIMLDWFHRIHGLRFAILRYFNAAGAWDGHGEHHEPESHLIPNVLHAALGTAGPVPIFGTDYPTPDGTCIRDFVHIYDLAAAHLAVLQALDTSDRHIYNLGNGTGFSVREVVAAATRITGRNVPFLDAPRRPGDPPILVASSERIRRELGWSPQYAGLEKILETAWNWHVAHPNGYLE